MLTSRQRSKNPGINRGICIKPNFQNQKEQSPLETQNDTVVQARAHASAAKTRAGDRRGKDHPGGVAGPSQNKSLAKSGVSSAVLQFGLLNLVWDIV